MLVELFPDPVKLALDIYKDHTSITFTKNKTTVFKNPKYTFRFVSLSETLNRDNKLSPKRVSQENKDLLLFWDFRN